MSSRRSRASSTADDEINDLFSKLRAEINRSGTAKVSVSKLLKETCKHIKRLQREVDNLSERISELIESPDTSSAEAEILRKLLVPQ
ncbi:hypothetical protein L1049_002905 [Liquidambar formosana]|uniref:BHLH domain-containing protein n=1 Tax=Liquidambar formosana TaxID=63359 RepID=A0AAP0R733_LIQFO